MMKQVKKTYEEFKAFCQKTAKIICLADDEMFYEDVLKIYQGKREKISK